MNFLCKEYNADSQRGSGNQKIIVFYITSADEILNKNDNKIIAALQEHNIHSSIGAYFYRFKNPESRFIKIGECSSKGGIGNRFSRGWHGTEKYADTYLAKK